MHVTDASAGRVALRNGRGRCRVKQPGLSSPLCGHVRLMSTAPIGNFTETNSAPELIDLWASALLARDADCIEDIVQRARRTHPSAGMIGN
jgi:hypothetical protein